ncbi:feruloyl esterase a [Moniliophthora roreri MCA 2997]|uniref:Feruloyl esterase a n=1 Tax=Moniliophthora roreri (strain MCA 2997) TaxID=1381753 RepID=V2WZR8_MONRO|nr:feruloyl esterase a [Moniliophthora roreri MCA 2997]
MSSQIHDSEELVDNGKPSAVSTKIFQQLVHYFKYASSAYTMPCLKPNGNHLVIHFSNPLLDIQGFVARDDDRKEFIVALRGSTSISHVLLDTQVLLVPCIGAGINASGGCRVHSGFLAGWDSVVLEVNAILDVEFLEEKYTNYNIITTGHSLGGALSTLAAVSLQQRYSDKGKEVRNYSYGAPRLGNRLFAEFVNDLLGERSYRVVHARDGVPTMIPRTLGYHHHGIEYWQTVSPASSETTLQCSRTNGEDPRCSASVPSGGINEDHMVYFGIVATTPFCF